MKASDIPTKFPIPFGNSAGPPFIRPIPTPSQIGIEAGAASLETGFPPVTFIDTGAGGTPPWGADVNGILNQVSAWCRWVSGGGPMKWDSAWSALVGGYPAGALVQSATTIGLFWLSIVDDNPTNPDTGGANWLSWVPHSFVNGQCYLTFLNATQVSLRPTNGNTVMLNKIPRLLAPGGILATTTSCFVNSVAAQTLAPSTTYFVYLFDSGGGVLALNFLTGANSGHVADNSVGNVGVEVRSIGGTPDSTLSFVGMVTTNALGNLIGQGYSVISWFNQRAIRLTGTAVNVSTASALTELSTAARVPFITFGQEAITLDVACPLITNNTGGNNSLLQNCLDGTPAGVIGSWWLASNSAAFAGGAPQFLNTPPEGLHFATILGGTSNPGGSVQASFAQAQCFVTVKG